MNRLRPPCALARDTRGATIIEFAIVAPVLCLFLVGGLDVGHTLYVRSVLEGEIQKAARDSALETGITRNADGALDAKIERQVRSVINTTTFSATRRNFRTFADAQAQRAEETTDTNHDGLCNNNEPYLDTNNNNRWDADGGDEGQGGAKDRVLYTVKISYPRILPLFKFIDVPSTVNMQASTVLMNQPYADQASPVPAQWKNCAP